MCSRRIRDPGRNRLVLPAVPQPHRLHKQPVAVSANRPNSNNRPPLPERVGFLPVQLQGRRAGAGLPPLQLLSKLPILHSSREHVGQPPVAHRLASSATPPNSPLLKARGLCVSRACDRSAWCAATLTSYFKAVAWPPAGPCRALSMTIPRAASTAGRAPPPHRCFSQPTAASCSSRAAHSPSLSLSFSPLRLLSPSPFVHADLPWFSLSTEGRCIPLNASDTRHLATIPELGYQSAPATSTSDISACSPAGSSLAMPPWRSCGWPCAR
jgi:hypothetical protein